MLGQVTERHVPTELQLALFRAVEDIHDLTSAIVVIVVDAHGTALAISGDENDIPEALRLVISGERLAAAGSVRELLFDIVIGTPTHPLNVSIYDVGGRNVLVILFDAEADLSTVQTVGAEAKAMLTELLTSSLN